ncbi:MAG: hypothetical protein HY915_02490 [Desulfovibrio sp.]|nr:hypothetical protein [Desulfovibrio sp.]
MKTLAFVCLLTLIPCSFGLTVPRTAQAQGPSRSECARVGLKSCEALKVFVASLRKAVAENDKAAVAAMIEYPIEIQLKNGLEIKDKDQFVKNYDTIMTKAVRDAILTQEPFVSPRLVIQMIGDGAQVWLSVNKRRLLVGTVIIG